MELAVFPSVSQLPPHTPPCVYSRWEQNTDLQEAALVLLVSSGSGFVGLVTCAFLNLISNLPSPN